MQDSTREAEEHQVFINTGARNESLADNRGYGDYWDYPNFNYWGYHRGYNHPVPWWAGYSAEMAALAQRQTATGSGGVSRVDISDVSSLELPPASPSHSPSPNPPAPSSTSTGASLAAKRDQPAPEPADSRALVVDGTHPDHSQTDNADPVSVVSVAVASDTNVKPVKVSQPDCSHINSADLVSTVDVAVSGETVAKPACELQPVRAHTDSADLVSAVSVGVSDETRAAPACVPHQQTSHTSSTILASS